MFKVGDTVVCVNTGNKYWMEDETRWFHKNILGKDKRKCIGPQKNEECKITNINSSGYIELNNYPKGAFYNYVHFRKKETKSAHEDLLQQALTNMEIECPQELSVS